MTDSDLAPRSVVFDGFTRDELTAAFRLVENPANWKLRINAVVPADADRQAISSAVIFFAGCLPEFVKVPGGYRVLAAGYYACIGS